MTISFKYKIVKRPDGTTVKTPSIPLQLQGDQSFDTLALVDSGADVSAIPKSIAEILGLDLSGKKTYAYGIGGKVKSITSKMRVKIDKGHEHYNFQIPVMVILDDYDFPILIGRSGFFKKFKITFDHRNEKVILKRITGG